MKSNSNKVQRFFDLETRVRRKEFWPFIIVSYSILFALIFFRYISKNSYPDKIATTTAVLLIYGIIILIPSIFLSIRRLHDTGRSGWWLIFGLIPIVGQITLLVFFIQDSQMGYNHWGEYPKFNGNL